MLPRAIPILFVPLLLLAAIPAGFDKKLDKARRAEHLLQRFTFGPTDADRAELERLGIEKWIERQLHPERIPENPVLTAHLEKLDSLAMPSDQIAARYPMPNVLRMLSRKGNIESIEDPALRARVQQFADRAAVREMLSADQLQTLRSGTPEERRSLLASLEPATREKVLGGLPVRGRQQALYGDDVATRREVIGASQQPVQVVYYDLTDAKLMRAVSSNRQLEAILTDFWFNHFNVYFDKGPVRVLATAYERDAIRPHVLGSFKDLLLATAQSPAMLFYLDNWSSAGNETAAKNPRRQGLNENYGRELLELHTLGVEGGYTQKDVTEVARCFTGWTIANPQRGGDFRFNPRTHDRGEKIVLGHRIPAGGGMEDGLKVIDILAAHPATARFISTKLAQRFVADQPPPALIDRMARTFTRTHGDIRAVLETMTHSPEFWSEGAFHAKIKTPFEMVVSALRATDAKIDSTFGLATTLATLGQPLYRKAEPTGYSSTAEEWTNSAALLARMNFALQLTANKLPGIHVDIPAEQARQRGLALGGPEFQRH